MARDHWHPWYFHPPPSYSRCSSRYCTFHASTGSSPVPRTRDPERASRGSSRRSGETWHQYKNVNAYREGESMTCDSRLLRASEVILHFIGVSDNHIDFPPPQNCSSVIITA